VRRLPAAAGLTVLAFAVPAWGATSDVQVRNTSFTPSQTTVAPGDTVRWTFAGPDTNHSVTSDSGQGESFDSDPGDPTPLHAPGEVFQHTFNSEGTFLYHCKVHATMKARVIVQAAGGQPPPGGSPPPPGGSPPPAGDTTAPAVSSLEAKGGRTCKGKKRKRCRKRPTRISFSLSEAADVEVDIERSRGESPDPVALEGEAGPNSMKLSARRVRRGRYTLTLAATDAAGNRSADATAEFRVR
jgi:plastocyanin